MKSARNVYLLAMILVFAACQKAGNYSVTSASLTALEGKWVTDCHADSKNYRIETAEFANDKFTTTLIDFADKGCSTETGLALNVSGTFSVGDRNADTDTSMLDFTASKVVYTIHSDEFLTYANKVRHCGSNDWQLKVSKEFAPSACSGAWEKAFEIFRISGTKLNMGDHTSDKSKDGLSAAGRPEKLNLEITYTKQ